MYDSALDTMKKMGDVVKSLYDKVGSLLIGRMALTSSQASLMV